MPISKYHVFFLLPPLPVLCHVNSASSEMCSNTLHKGVHRMFDIAHNEHDSSVSCRSNKADNICVCRQRLKPYERRYDSIAPDGPPGRDLESHL